MSAESDVDILHLSDLQFGGHHRYKGDTPYDTLVSKITEDLEVLSEAHNVELSIVVITGDLAERARPSEYLEMRRFLDTLIKNISIDSSRVVIVPGNHDVNWDMFVSSESYHKAFERPFEPPFFEKFRIFKDFYDQFYDGKYVFSEKLYNIFSYPEKGLIFAGLNSCVKESANEHFGWIGLQQVHQAGQEIDKIDPARKCLRIAAFHHNFFRQSQLDNENLKDADEIRIALGKYGFSMLMHGHRHVAAIQQSFIPGSISQIVVSTGSAGLDHSVLPDHPNQYQIVRLSHNSISLLMRQYSSQSVGSTGYGRWCADTSLFESGLVELPFRDLIRPATIEKIHVQPSKKKTKVFIAHSSKDNRIIGRLAKDLRKMGLSVWYDEWEILPGHSIVKQIEKGLSQADFLLIALSTHSVGSVWVMRELNAALMKSLKSKGIKILPILLEDCKIPLFILDIRFADFRYSYEEGLKDLSRAFPDLKDGDGIQK